MKTVPRCARRDSGAKTVSAGPSPSDSPAYKTWFGCAISDGCVTQVKRKGTGAPTPCRSRMTHPQTHRSLISTLRSSQHPLSSIWTVARLRPVIFTAARGLTPRVHRNGGGQLISIQANGATEPPQRALRAATPWTGPVLLLVRRLLPLLQHFTSDHRCSKQRASI